MFPLSDFKDMTAGFWDKDIFSSYVSTSLLLLDEYLLIVNLSIFKGSVRGLLDTLKLMILLSTNSFLLFAL